MCKVINITLTIIAIIFGVHTSIMLLGRLYLIGNDFNFNITKVQEEYYNKTDTDSIARVAKIIETTANDSKIFPFMGKI